MCAKTNKRQQQPGTHKAAKCQSPHAQNKNNQKHTHKRLPPQNRAVAHQNRSTDPLTTPEDSRQTRNLFWATRTTTRKSTPELCTEPMHQGQTNQALLPPSIAPKRPNPGAARLQYLCSVSPPGPDAPPATHALTQYSNASGSSHGGVLLWSKEALWLMVPVGCNGSGGGVGRRGGCCRARVGGAIHARRR